MELDLAFGQLYEHVREHFAAADGCHDFDHTLRVMRNAEKLLAAQPEANREAVRFSALLHDIGRVHETFTGKAPNHAERGAAEADRLLSEMEFPEQLKNLIVDAVRRHRYRGKMPPVTIEAKILFDADKLDSLGAVGLGRSFLFAGKLGARVHNTADEALAGEPYSKEDTCYREYLVKLRHIPERLFTAEGRKLAAERLTFMQNFFSELDRELTTEPAAHPANPVSASNTQ